MNNEPLIELPWHGYETIESISALLNEAEQIKITLPENYNHALFCALHPGEPVSVENIDVSGGPELLASISTVSGLEEFSSLDDALTRARASIHVISPATIVITLPVKNMNT
jgi:hypothetical protein